MLSPGTHDGKRGYLPRKLSAPEHVGSILKSCSQSMYALRLLRAHGVCDAAIQTIFRSVIITKLTYAASAWRIFTKASDRQRIDALIRRSQRHGYYAVHLLMFEELCENIDDNLFSKTCTNSNRVLHSMFPPSLPRRRNITYSLRPRSHSLSLPDHDNYLSDCNFITRMLYKQCY